MADDGIYKRVSDGGYDSATLFEGAANQNMQYQLAGDVNYYDLIMVEAQCDYSEMSGIDGKAPIYIREKKGLNIMHG